MDAKAKADSGGNRNPEQIQNRIKRLDLLGGIGAGILGAGLALLFAKWLQPFALPALVVGIVSHGFAMYQKSRLERREGVLQPAWSGIAERICWAMLAILVLYVGDRLLR